MGTLTSAGGTTFGGPHFTVVSSKTTALAATANRIFHTKGDDGGSRGVVWECGNALTIKGDAVSVSGGFNAGNQFTSQVTARFLGNGQDNMFQIRNKANAAMSLETETTAAQSAPNFAEASAFADFLHVVVCGRARAIPLVSASM